MKRFTILLIHNTHTDVGFTGTQEEIGFQNYDFLLQVISALESGKFPGFRWQCENTWQIDNFYEHANSKEKSLLEKWIKCGKIGLSGNYLNMTELADSPTLEYWVKHARQYASSIDVNSYSAMSCDVNGYGCALPDILSANGYKYFLGSIHTHHGMFPMYKCPSCFKWRGPNGGEIITFISEHYNLGNELGLCPHSMLSYSIHDKYSQKLENTLFHTDWETTEKEELEVAEYRIKQYVEGLQKSGYEFDFVPVLVSGAYTDNAAPNAAICNRIKKLNNILGGDITIEFTILDEFFARIEASNVKLPIESGDFPDWWATGIGSLPNSVRIYREAQRNMRLVDKLKNYNICIDDRLYDYAMKNAVLFAEHTWSYCATVFNPWSIMNKLVEQNNAAYASNYSSAAKKLLLSALRDLGNVQIRPDKHHSWQVLNPNAFEAIYPISLVVESWEYVNGRKFDPGRYELRDGLTGDIIPSQVHQTSRGPSFNSVVTLEANGRSTITLFEKVMIDGLIDHNKTISTDGIRDMHNDTGAVTASDISTEYFNIKIIRNDGIVSIVEKSTGTEMLSSSSTGAFSGIHDITHIPNDSGIARKLARREMGRNLVAFKTERSIAQLADAVVTEDGIVYTTLELTYNLQGIRRYIVRLKVYKHQPLLKADIIVGMEGGLEPENLYISLPFAHSGYVYLGKAGYVVRPGIDQISGSCQTVYAVQDGIICQNEHTDTLITMDDLPLALFGLPEPGKVRLCGDQGGSITDQPIFAVAANNYWETNFPCNIAGDYQFTVTVMLNRHQQPEKQLETIKAFSEGAILLRQ